MTEQQSSRFPIYFSVFWMLVGAYNVGSGLYQSDLSTALIGVVMVAMSLGMFLFAVSAARTQSKIQEMESNA